MTYSDWITEQSARIGKEVWRIAIQQGGCGDFSVYVHPANGDKWGSLELARETPDGATDVVSFPGVGTRVSAIPAPHLSSLLYHACQQMPVCGP